MKGKKRLTVGFYNITGCCGCLLSFLFNEPELLDMLNIIDIRAFPFIKGENKGNPDMSEIAKGTRSGAPVRSKKTISEHPQDSSGCFDIIFMEGLVASEDDLALLKEAREKCGTLVALGACACTGCVPASRNFVPEERYKHLLFRKIRKLQDTKPVPIDKHVKVDFYIPGCPPDSKHIYRFIKDIVMHKMPEEYDNPVCVECRLNQNHCLLDEHRPCMGPVTKGGCDSVCINGKFECWGCRGPTRDANYKVMVELLEGKGLYNIEHVKERIRTFCGLKLPAFDEYLDKEK